MSNIFKLKFLARIDKYFLLNHPFLWVSQIHYVTFYGLASLFVLSIIAFNYPINYHDVPDLKFVLYFILIIYMIFYSMWMFHQFKYNENHFFHVKKKSYEIIKYLTYLLISFIFFISPFIILKTLCNNMLSKEVKSDIHLLKDFLIIDFDESLKFSSYRSEFENEKKSRVYRMSGNEVFTVYIIENMEVRGDKELNFFVKFELNRFRFIEKYFKSTENQKEQILKIMCKYYNSQNCLQDVRHMLENFPIDILNILEKQIKIEQSNTSGEKKKDNIEVLKNLDFDDDIILKIIGENYHKKYGETWLADLKRLGNIIYYINKNISAIYQKGLYSTSLFRDIYLGDISNNFDLMEIFIVLMFLMPIYLLNSRNFSFSIGVFMAFNIVFFLSSIFFPLLINNFIEVKTYFNVAESYMKSIIVILYFSVFLFLYLLSIFMILKRRDDVYSDSVYFFLLLFIFFTPSIFLVLNCIFLGQIVFNYFLFIAGILLYITLIPFIKGKENMLFSLPRET